MSHLKRLLITTVIATVFCLSTGTSLAQNPPPAGGGFDPARMQKMIMDNLRPQFDVKDDAEWSLLQERIQKVIEARMDATASSARMMGRIFRRPGTDANPDSNAAPRRGFGGASSPEEEALQRSIDAKASNEELRAAIAKVVEARKQKQARLEKSQAELREVLSTRQEAIASLLGLL